MFATLLFCHVLHIHSRKTGNLFSLLLCSLLWMQIVGYVLAWRSYPFVCKHYTSSLASLCKLIWRHWIYKMLVRYIFVECVNKIKHIPSVIHLSICRAVCFQLSHFPCEDWENIYTLSHYHHQIGRKNYYPLLRVKSWNNGMRCMSVSILTMFCRDEPDRKDLAIKI